MATILVSEDNADIQEMVRFILEGEGYDVLRAGSGKETLRILGKERPDMILLDLRLPGLDGFGVLRELRKMDVDPPPVVVFSAKGLEEDREAAIEAGARDFLPKPFTLAELLAVVGKVLRESG